MTPDGRLLAYLQEYQEDTEECLGEYICTNTAVNNILSAYARKARSEQIEVTLDVELGRNLTISELDLVTILANAYENAIYGCLEVKKRSQVNGLPKPESTGGIGVLSIIETAEKFHGEYDLKNDNGVFIFRLILNIPSGSEA